MLHPLANQNPLITELINEFKEYNRELLINNENNDWDIAVENEIIKSIQIANPSTVLVAANCLRKCVWDDGIIMER